MVGVALRLSKSAPRSSANEKGIDSLVALLIPTLGHPDQLTTRDPFSEDSTLRNIVTGVIADNRVNVNKAKEVGKNILKNMTHKNTEEYTFKKDKQVITMDGHIHDF